MITGPLGENCSSGLLGDWSRENRLVMLVLVITYYLTIIFESDRIQECPLPWALPGEWKREICTCYMGVDLSCGFDEIGLIHSSHFMSFFISIHISLVQLIDEKTEFVGFFQKVVKLFQVSTLLEWVLNERVTIRWLMTELFPSSDDFPQATSCNSLAYLLFFVKSFLLRFSHCFSTFSRRCSSF